MGRPGSGEGQRQGLPGLLLPAGREQEQGLAGRAGGAKAPAQGL
jgi:hypothetical protein